jgi:hypothetical protein
MTQSHNQQVERTNQRSPIPSLPPWPTSKPGPRITEPPAGQKRVPVRPEQVVEVDYDQEKGKSAVRSEEK